MILAYSTKGRIASRSATQGATDIAHSEGYVSRFEILLCIQRLGLVATGFPGDSRERFMLREIVAVLIKAHFDEAWYIKRYPDVEESVSHNAVSGGFEHYTRFGFAEMRLPFRPKIDQPAYAAHYPDVENAVAAGDYEDPEDHFVAIGFSEQRDFDCA